MASKSIDPNMTSKGDSKLTETGRFAKPFGPNGSARAGSTDKGATPSVNKDTKLPKKVGK